MQPLRRGGLHGAFRGWLATCSLYHVVGYMESLGGGWLYAAFMTWWATWNLSGHGGLRIVLFSVQTTVIRFGLAVRC